MVLRFVFFLLCLTTTQVSIEVSEDALRRQLHPRSWFGSTWLMLPLQWAIWCNLHLILSMSSLSFFTHFHLESLSSRKPGSSSWQHPFSQTASWWSAAAQTECLLWKRESWRLRICNQVDHAAWIVFRTVGQCSQNLREAQFFPHLIFLTYLNGNGQPKYECQRVQSFSGYFWRRSCCTDVSKGRADILKACKVSP